MPYNIVTSQIGKKPTKNIMKDIAKKVKESKPKVSPKLKQKKNKSKTPAIKEKSEPVTKETVTESLRDNNLNLIASQVEKQQDSYSDAQQTDTHVVQTGGNVQKPVSDTKSRGKQGQNNMPPGFDAPPPPSNTVFDIVGKTTEQKVAEASGASRQVKTRQEPVIQEQSEKKEPKKTQKKEDIVFTQKEFASLVATKRKLERIGQEQIDWKPDPKATYYTFDKDTFDTRFLPAMDLNPNMEGIQLTPHQADIYMKKMGEYNIQQAKKVDPGSDILGYTKKHAVFEVDDKKLSWKELKEQEPALTLTKTPGQDVQLRYDYSSWYEKQDPVTKGLGRVGGGLANFDYIIETVARGDQEKGTEIISKWTYEQKKRLDKGDVLGTVINIPAVQNIALPAAGGFAFGLAVRGGSSVASMIGSKGYTTAEKALRYTGKGVIVGGAAAAGGLAAVDVAKTEPDKQLAKTLSYGAQFVSFTAGASVGQRMKLPKVQREIVEYKIPGKPQRMVGQKYVEIMGKKVYSPKQTVAVGPRQAPVKTRLGLGSGKKGFDIQPDLGYKKVGGKPSSIFEIKQPSSLQVSNWQGKTFIETGKGWQPKTGIYKQVGYPVTVFQSKTPVKYKWPGKPVRYGAYNMPYVSVLKEPMFLESGSMTTTEGMVKVRKSKKPSFKDFNKEFRAIDKSLSQQPGVSQGQKQQTVQLLKLKQAQKQQTVMQQQQKQALKVLSEQKLLQKQAKKSMFHPEYRHQAIGQVYDVKTIKAVFPVQLKAVRSDLARISARVSRYDIDTQKQSVYPIYASGSADATSDKTSFVNISTGKFKQPKITPDVLMPSIPFFNAPPSKKQVRKKVQEPSVMPIMPKIPYPQSTQKRLKYDIDKYLKYQYRFRKFDIPSLKKLLGS